ncbi:MAG: glycerol-3-phosphate dehydrogenase [Chlamydiales bacterium]|jgi:glycerol-3-phosphate dehydrogenase
MVVDKGVKSIASREEQLGKLQSETFDILIVGGGATGAGVALDAATRGLRVALIEGKDFSSGTSSRSTKLIHGGLRYLEMAVKKLDIAQYRLVTEALKERAILFDIAPHLTRPIPIATPLYKILELPYFFTGLKLYDWLSGGTSLGPSSFLGRDEVIEKFDFLKQEGLKGAVQYFDGQFDDARMNVAIILTAAIEGAAVANYVEAVGFVKDEDKISGMEVRDVLTGESWVTRAKVVVNATGPFADNILRMDDPEAESLVEGSSGTHIFLDKRFSSSEAGILIPKTSDGRILFLLPWEGGTLAGTTDVPCGVSSNPKPTADDVDYILEHLRNYLSFPVERSDVRSAWTGIRPLVKNADIDETADLSRDHVIKLSASGLLTVVGGKWTTYRKMAEEAVDEALLHLGVECEKPSRTAKTKLVGSATYTRDLIPSLMEDFHLDEDVAKHLSHSYGGRAVNVAKIAEGEYRERLAEGYPYIKAEVVYAVEHEYACTPLDVLGRRVRLSFVNQRAAIDALPKVVKIMSSLFSWSDERVSVELENGERALADYEVF